MLWKSFGFALGIGALAIGTMTVACSGTDSELPPDVGDPWAVSASSETRSALGVETWGFRVVDSSTLSVRGYDADNRRVVEVRQRIAAKDPYRWTLDFGVASGSKVSTFRYGVGSRVVAGGVEVSGHVFDDSLRADAKARKVIERLRADARLPSRRSGVGIETNGLRTRDLASGNGSDIASGDGDDIASGDGDDVASGKDDRLTNEDQDGGTGNNNGDGNNGGKNDSDQQCQQSDQCGGDMMSSLSPVLEMLGSAGEGLSSFAGVYECMNGDAGAPGSPIPLMDAVTCALAQGSGDGGAGGTGSGGGSPLGSLMEAFGSMQSMGQNCNCPQ